MKFVSPLLMDWAMPKETAKITRPTASSRGGCRGNGAERDGDRQRQDIRHDEVQGDQRDIHKQCRDAGLHDADDRGLLPGLLQGGQPELMADGEGDEAQRHVGDHRQGIDLLKSVESEAGDAQPSQDAGADQHAGHQVGSNVRQMKFVKQAGHQQSREQSNRNQQQGLHKGIQHPFQKIQGDRKALAASADA